VKLLRPLNRVCRGKAYYRWILMIPPAQVRELGWQAGEELETRVERGVLYTRRARGKVGPKRREKPRAPGD
jgi:hypothetical protein